MKHCKSKTCQQQNPQPLTSFNKNKSREDGLHYRCKSCVNLATKKWQKVNPERTRIKGDLWKKKNKDKVKTMQKRWSLLKKYNMSLEEYSEKLKQQDFRCAICKKHQDDLGTALAVDHCHKTGKVRDLLCSTCNSYLGYIKDTIMIGRNLTEYLRKYV